MSKRRVDPQLGEAFITGASSWYRLNGKPGCWLRGFDEEQRPCTSGRLEGVHLISRQRIRNVLGPLLVPPTSVSAGSPTEASRWIDSIVEVAEWDGRNGALGCEGHHRRFDSHMTPRLVVPVAALPLQMLGFIVNWGLEAEAERKFDSSYATLDEVLEARRPQLEKHWGYRPAVPA